MRVARGYEVKVIAKDGTVTKFGGFKETVSFKVATVTKEVVDAQHVVKFWGIMLAEV